MTEDSNLAPDKIDKDEKDLSNVSFTANFGLISDLHAKESDKDEVLDHVTEMVNFFETRNVDRVIVLGDVIEETENKQDDVDRLREVTEPIQAGDFETTYVLGNHDVVSLNRSEFLDVVNQDSSYGDFSINESLKGIFLDSSAPQFKDSRGSVPEDQIEFLENQIENTDKKCLIFVHHPVSYQEIPDNAWFVRHPECAFAHNKYKIEEILNDHDNVIATVNGHTHIGNVSQGDVTDITVSAFNKYNPDHPDITGYHSTLDVSECRLNYQEFTPLDFETTIYRENSTPDNSRVAFGGTFDPIHDGHKQLFESALEIGDVIVGLTSDDLAPKTRHEERYILPFNERKAALENVLSSISSQVNSDYTVKELTEPEGIVTEDDSITHLVVSPETLGRAIDINETRVDGGYDPLTIEVIEPALAEDGEVLSSTRICKGEIDVHGNLTPSANGRQPI